MSGSSAAGDKYPTVMILSPEASLALRLAAEFEQIAAGLEAEMRQ